MAEIFIYSTLSLHDARGTLEDDLEEFLGDTGTVTGGGGGERGWNVDLEVAGENLAVTILRLEDFLDGWGVPPDTYFDVYEDSETDEKLSRHHVYSTPEVMEWVKQTLTYLAERDLTDAQKWHDIKREIQDILTDLDTRVRGRNS